MNENAYLRGQAVEVRRGLHARQPAAGAPVLYLHGGPGGGTPIAAICARASISSCRLS